MSDIVYLIGRSGRLDGPRHLICPTLLGVGSNLTPDIRARIDRFLGLSAVTMQTHDSAAEPDFVEHPLTMNALELEAFLVDGLGVQVLRPLDSRQPRAPPDLVLALGRCLCVRDLCKIPCDTRRGSLCFMSAM